MANFNFKNFKNVSKLTLNGGAEKEGNALRVTSADNFDQPGSAFYFKPINIKSDTSFETNFQFRLQPDSVGQLSGITFILQNDPRKDNALGEENGFTLGYQGISESVAVEFDAFDSSDTNDPNDNHIGVNQNGDINSLTTVLANQALGSGELLYAWVNYNGKNDKLDVFLSNTQKKPRNPLLSTFIDIKEVVGSKAYVGFSGGNSEDSTQEILKWEFSTSEGSTSKPTKGIEGDEKNNRLEGTNKSDTIDGQNGNDTLIGAAGNDTLTGGGGADDFLLGSGKVYRTKDLGIDTIKDFQSNVDDIILDTETFITLKSKLGEGFSIGREFEIVKNTKAVDGSLADIVYDSSKGDLYYNPNSALPGFGGGGKIATLEGAPKISASDFVLE